jgi:hypothetical protein
MRARVLAAPSRAFGLRHDRPSRELLVRRVLPAYGPTSDDPFQPAAEVERGTLPVSRWPSGSDATRRSRRPRFSICSQGPLSRGPDGPLVAPAFRARQGRCSRVPDARRIAEGGLCPAASRDAVSSRAGQLALVRSGTTRTGALPHRDGNPSVAAWPRGALGVLEDSRIAHGAAGCASFDRVPRARATAPERLGCTPRGARS